MFRTAAALLALLPALALAGERVLVVKTTEDAAYPADEAFCGSRPFGTANVRLGASVWSLQTRASKGEVMNEGIKLMGTATGCGQLTSPFPDGPPQPFAMQFDLEDGRYVAEGSCDIVSNSVGGNFVLLAGCSLKLTSKPDGVVGGFATSASVFNPAHTPGFATGSVWTLHIYTED